MIVIEDLRFRSLDIPRLEIPRGTTAVIGPNGCGKTTLLKLLAGISLPESGSIRIQGTGPRRAEIGWVNEFPDRNIIFSTVADEVASPLRFRHLPEEEIRSRTETILEYLGIPALKDRPVRGLSGGEKVLVALAAAVITRPQVLVLDEFDSHLDARSSGRILALLAGLHIPYIIRCTQDMDAAVRDDYLVFIMNGKALHTGTPGQVIPELAGTLFYPMSWRCGYQTHA